MSGHPTQAAHDSCGARFIRSVRYELWQPISAIIGCAELLATRETAEQQRAALFAEIRQAAGRLAYTSTDSNAGR